MLTTSGAAEIESIVHGRIRAILEDRGDGATQISGEDKLSATLGLTSLDLAQLVAELEAALGVDPFAKLVSITAVRSVDDLVAAYRLAFAPAASVARDDGLAEAARRARARRAHAEGGG
jgi:acyl carrier protein